MAERAFEMRGELRNETLAFVADPRIFTDVCSVMCDSIYDFLHGEGFLDLPANWRAHLYRAGATG